VISVVWLTGSLVRVLPQCCRSAAAVPPPRGSSGSHFVGARASFIPGQGVWVLVLLAVPIRVPLFQRLKERHRLARGSVADHP
jgi:hypothetical protein